MSKIEWTEETWNPTVGCRRVSPGCDNCYASKEAHRKEKLFPHYHGVTGYNEDGKVDWTGVFNVAPDHIMNKPLRNRRPTTYFVNSMSDLFGEGVSDETIKRVFEIMRRTPHHRYQILTKRPNRAVKLAPSLPWPDHVWMGVSIEENKFVGRADLLRRIPAKIRFISAEPLLGPLTDLNFTNIDWIIVGGESGSSRHLIREMEPQWARDLRDRAVAAKTSFFFKQWGRYDEDGRWRKSKAEAGRELDGRIWDEMPGAASLKTVSSPPTTPSPGKPVCTPAPMKPISTAPVSSAPVEPASKTWSSIEEFRAELAYERAAEGSPPKLMDKSLRLTLREPIWRRLQKDGPMSAAELRERVLTACGLNPKSARTVNFHAWALVDLQKGGFVVRDDFEKITTRGRVKKEKVYRAVKPRFRVRAET